MLNDMKITGRDELGADDRVGVVLGETIRVMGEIDVAIGGLGGWSIDE